MSRATHCGIPRYHLSPNGLLVRQSLLWPRSRVTEASYISPLFRYAMGFRVYIPTKRRFDLLVHFASSDISFNAHGSLMLHLGVTLRVASIRGPLCLVTAMRAYLADRVAHRVGVPDINTHSFQIDGAPAELPVGLSDGSIKIMSRWSGDSYQRYVHVADDTVINFNARMSSARTVYSM